MSAVQLCLLVGLLVVQAQTQTVSPTPSPTTDAATTSPGTSPTTSVTISPTTTGPSLGCPAIGTQRKNNWPETKTGLMISPSAPGVTDVVWGPYNTSSDFIDANGYVAVTLNKATQTIDFNVLPSMEGVRDFPKQGYPDMASMKGTCQMTCENGDSGEFAVELTITDQNTADPVFTSPAFNGDVLEAYPVGLIIPDLVISASDADAGPANYEILFTLQKGSPFSLTPAVKTDDLEPTYTTQLKLDQALDWKTMPSYQLNITAMNTGGGPSSMTTVTVNVIDVDTMQPAFVKDTYTVKIDDPESTGPLKVSIKAIDPDAPGNLTYHLQDPSGGQWDAYFSLDPNTAELNLTQDITDKLQPYETTITFILQATEVGGYSFICRSALVVQLPAKAMTTTTEPPTSSTVVTSTEASPSTSPDTSTSTESTVTTPMTSPSTTPDSTTSTPTTSPATSTPSSTPMPTSTPTPTPTPTPTACVLFSHRQYLASPNEDDNSEVITIMADGAIGDVTYFLRTPGYEDSFALDADTGTLTKLKTLSYQLVSLLVQAVPDGEKHKNQTNDTDIVEWDETLILVDIIDVNDQTPVLNCAAYASSCDAITVGFPASETASLPAPLLRLTATDGDTGDYGVDGIKYTVDSPALKMDSSGMLYLVKQQSKAFTATITAMDNNGNAPFQKSTAVITLVPVRDDQVFFVRTDSQLTDTASVTSLLGQISAAGGYKAVFSLDFQPLASTDSSSAKLRLSDDADGSTVYIYALRESGGVITAVNSDDIEKTLDDNDSVDYIETRDDQMSGGGSGDSGSDTGLIVAVALLSCLLVAVIVAAVLRQRQLVQRSAATYSRQANDAESRAGSVKNSNYSSTVPRRESVTPAPSATYSNRAYQPTEQPVSSGIISGSGTLFQSRDDDQFRASPSPPPVAATATLVDIEEPTTAEPESKPESKQEPEPEQPVAEPTPDYATKSVGFQETVICVSPQIEPHEEEEEEEDEDEEDEEGEGGDGAAPEQTESQQKTGDGDSESDEDDML